MEKETDQKGRVNGPRMCLVVYGENACFTRPEMKVERVSYEVITPSAARGIFEAIMWKPAIRWEVSKIEILKPIKWVSVKRNEVSSVVSAYNIKNYLTGKGEEPPSIFIEDKRQQRASLVLKDVEYRIHARLKLTSKAGPRDNIIKFVEMFKRRASKGQCYNQPYLGCREFTAGFHYTDKNSSDPPPIDETRNIGWMLHDMDYTTSKPQPRFFNAYLEAGVIRVPPIGSEDVVS